MRPACRNDRRLIRHHRDTPPRTRCGKTVRCNQVGGIGVHERRDVFETAIVVDSRRDPVASRDLDGFCERINLAFVAVDEAQARIAREAYRDFGKGSGHKAKLNFGDCFAYALAKVTGEPLLYKGRDFAHTDVASALK